MSSTVDYIELVLEAVRSYGNARAKKMFGEYMIYLNDKPILLVCDNTVFVKKLDALAEYFFDAEEAAPYNGAKNHYILDIENASLLETVIPILERVTPLPKSKKLK